jgi:hypothetical protein
VNAANTTRCRHCGEPIAKPNGKDWAHIVGPESYLHRCDPSKSHKPYGLDAEPLPAGIEAIEREIRARMKPPHMDGLYRTGQFMGLVLARHLLDPSRCDPDECEGHERDLVAPAVQ